MQRRRAGPVRTRLRRHRRLSSPRDWFVRQTWPVPGEFAHADGAFDANWLRDDLTGRGTEPIIPSRSSRRFPAEFGREATAGNFFSSLKTERAARKIYRARDEARADVFDDIDRVYNSRRRHSTLGSSRPGRARGASYVSLTWCPKNRQQATQGQGQRHSLWCRHRTETGRHGILVGLQFLKGGSQFSTTGP